MDSDGRKIGEVAEQTGLSIRSLRHWDEVGVVSPSGYTPGGFRLYSDADVERILLVRRMKPLDFTLEEMKEFLDAADRLRGDAGDGQASATIARFEDETRIRLDRLRTRTAYAEEFLDLVGGLTSDHSRD